MLLRYPGGKRRHLDRFIRPFFNNLYATISKDTEFREPFVGAGAVVLDLLSHGIVSRIWINDADPGLVALWNTIIEEPQRLIELVQTYTPTVDDFERFKELSIQHNSVAEIDDQVIAALAKLVTHQASFSGLGVMSGVLGGSQVDDQGEPKRYLVDSRWSPDTLIKNIQTAHRLLSAAVIRTGRCTNLDYSEVLAERGEFTSLSDPPYFQMGKDLYLWFMNHKDHRELARCLRSVDQPWLLTLDDCKEVRTLYRWAHMVPINAGSSINSLGRQRELLICSHEYKDFIDMTKIDLTAVAVPDTSYPTIPAEVYRSLPLLLKETTSQFAAGTERDIFMTGTLPVIAGCMINVVGDHGDGPMGLNLYTVVQGAAATGKGVLRFSRRLGEMIDNRLLLAKVTETDEDQQQAIEGTFFLPANASVRALVDALAANRGRGVIHESELQTLVNSLRQGWGNFKDLLLKSFHQEAVTLTRKSQTIRILDPAVSMALSGTPESVKALVQSQSDGLFSRVAFYAYDSSEPWKTQRPSARTNKRERVIATAAAQLDDLHRVLESRKKGNLVVRLDERHWDLIDRAFEDDLARLRDAGAAPALEASVKRAGVIAFRVACLLTLLRSSESSVKLDTVKELIAVDADVITGVCLAQVYLRHACSLAGSLGDDHRKDSNRGNREFVYAALPNVTFTTAEAEPIAETLGITIRTLKQALSDLTADGRLDRVGHGKYVKNGVPKTNGSVKANGASRT